MKIPRSSFFEDKNEYFFLFHKSLKNNFFFNFFLILGARLQNLRHILLRNVA